MTKVQHFLILAVLIAALAFSAALNISVCAWGCPSTVQVYSLQASFFVLLGLILWVLRKFFRLKRVDANAKP